MKLLHRRFHLVRGGNRGPAWPEGVRPVKVPGWLYPVAIVIALAVMIVELQPAEMLGFGGALAREAAPRATSDAAAKPSTAQEQPFDYFPDHYINQAKEPAEPIATF